MRKQIGISIFIAQAFFFATIQGFAQQTPVQQSPSIPDDVLGSQLIAWSQLQKPEPVMQGQSQEQQQSLQRSDQPSSHAQALPDRSNTDRTNQDGNRFVPSATNGINRSAETNAKH
jgi:hypothetical protein